MSKMAQGVFDSVRSAIAGQGSAQRGMLDMLQSFVGMGGFGGGGSSSGGGGGGSGVPPPDSPAPPLEPGPEGKKGMMAGLAGMLVGMVAGMIRSPTQMLRPPEGSEAVIGRTNANVARSMADAPGNLAKGAAKDVLTTSFAVPGIGPMIAGPVALAKASLKAAGMIDSWSSALLSSVGRLRAMSPTMGAADAEQRYRTFARDMRTANLTGPSAMRLSKSYQDLQDNVAPISDGATVVLNKLATIALLMLNAVVTVGKKFLDIIPGVDALEELLELEKKKNNSKDRTQGQEFLKQIRDGKFGENGRRIPRK